MHRPWLWQSPFVVGSADSDRVAIANAHGVHNLDSVAANISSTRRLVQLEEPPE